MCLSAAFVIMAGVDRTRMSVSANEISWQVLRQIVHDWAGASAELDEVKSLEGGSISTTLLLHCKAGDRAVLKLTPHRANRAHADEELQLKLLREAGVPVPQVYRCVIGTLDHPFSYILMEYVDGVDLTAAKAGCTPEEFDAVQAELAEIVRRMHDRTAPQYTRVTAAGSTCHDSWPDCYRETFDPIWHDVEKSGQLSPKCRKTMSKIHERLGRLLTHADCPRLIHADLWSGNLLVRRDDATGRWRIAALLDPNCKYGHCEMELAYLELFHTVTPAFMRAYQQSQRLGDGYHKLRKPVYHLYEMLNHLHLFGPEYLKPTIASIERVGALV